jgi:hypothetical protein
MKKESTTSVVALLVALVTLFLVYISSGTTQTTLPATPAEQEDVAEMKKQISVLEERVSFLLEKQTEPRIHKEFP